MLDSTILEDAVATQDTVTQLVAAVRRVRRLVAAAREVELAAHDYDRPGKPECAWDDLEAKQALVSGLVNDALVVLEAVADAGLEAERVEAVALLAWSPAKMSRQASGREAGGSLGRSPSTG